MSERLAEKLTMMVCVDQYTCNDDKEKIQYGFNIFISEFTKFFSLCFVFMFIGKLNMFSFSLLIFCTIRVFAGGFHANSNVKCFAYSLLIFLITTILVPALTFWTNYLSYFIAFSSLIIIILKAPVSSAIRPIKSVKRRMYLRYASIIVTSIWIAILFNYTMRIELIKCGVSTIFLEAIQLLLSKSKEDI